MTTGHIFIASSLDGYIARQDGDVSWLTPNGAEKEDHGYSAFYESIDGIIMGRGTWDVASRFDPWPFDKPVIVLSSHLSQADLPPGLGGAVQVWNCSPHETMQRVAAEGWNRAYIDGGKLIQSFLAASLIADLTLTRVPVLLGQGIPLFGRLPKERALMHQGTRTFASGLVQSHYQIIP
ncbi:MAG: dihydrofolate reductase [Loktanella sp.]|nr:dihydrofolate reductase [Loktanella sp.]